MKQKRLRITQSDFLLANRRAARQEEIDAHGHPVQFRTMLHKSKKTYDRNRIKRAAIESDDSSFFSRKSDKSGNMAIFAVRLHRRKAERECIGM